MKEISYKDLNFNAITRIDEGWMLITAGNKEHGFNTMTASWGHLGEIWGLPTSWVYVRPQRYTREFTDREDYYTLSFFPEENRKALAYLGSHSGRDGDKVAHVGLTPVFDGDITYFEEAELVIVCRKIYRGRLSEENFLDKKVVERNYPGKDFHYVYGGEIVKVLKK